MNDLEKYYNKFNEDKRLKTRHGQVEMFVCLNYIKKYIAGRQNLNILDIGAGTGAYTKALSEVGHNVVAVEPVKKNFSVLKQNCPTAQLLLGDARNLRKLKDESFDIVLLFGPLYHLKSEEDKMQAIMEAKRVAKKGAILMNMFLMNDYAVLSYAFKEQNIKTILNEQRLDKNFKIIAKENDLYSYARIEDINRLYKKSGLKRKELIAVDSATDYMREVINKLTEEEFNTFKNYMLYLSKQKNLLGASSHCLDILEKV